MRSPLPRRRVIAAVASAMALSLVALSAAACSSSADDAQATQDAHQTATSTAPGTTEAHSQHANDPPTMTGHTVINTDTRTAESQHPVGESGAPPDAQPTEAATGPVTTPGGATSGTGNSTTDSGASTATTAPLPGGILSGPLLVAPTWLNDDLLTFPNTNNDAANDDTDDDPDAEADASSDSNSDSTLGSAFCGFLFGTPEQVGTVTLLPGSVSLDPISGYKTSGANGGRDGGRDDGSDANGASSDENSDASAETSSGASSDPSDRTSSYVCLYDSDQAQTLALQVTNGPPLDSDLPGSPIIVISGSVQAVLSYAPDYKGKTISTEKARRWLSQAAQRVEQSDVPGR